MIAFFWLLLAMGVAYGAKISGRKPFAWFLGSVLLSPLVGGAALVWINSRRS